MSGTVKTRDGTIDDPISAGPLIRTQRPSVSNEQVHTDFQPTRFLRRNVKETMTYFTLVALMMLVLSPVLVPLVITGLHTIGNLRTA
jgi:hypothetical protein